MHAFLAALELAHDQQTVGAEYVDAILARPAAAHVPAPAPADLAPHLPAAVCRPQPAVERDLAQDEQYVANRTTLVGGGPCVC
jgi:hypothetical protein